MFQTTKCSSSGRLYKQLYGILSCWNYNKVVWIDYLLGKESILEGQKVGSCLVVNLLRSASWIDYSCFSTVIYTGSPRRKEQNFGRVFLMLKYTDITQNTYIQGWTVTKIMAREKCGLLVGLRTVPCQLTAFRMSVLDCRVRLQKYRWRSYVSTPLWLTMHVMYSAWNP